MRQTAPSGSRSHHVYPVLAVGTQVLVLVEVFHVLNKLQILCGTLLDRHVP